MTSTNTGIGPASDVVGSDLKRTARTAGLLYLGFFITGIAGSIMVRGRLFAADNPDDTLSNLMAHESLARAGIALELGIVLTQALTAMWLYRMFRSVDTFAAGSLAVFGMVNAIAVLGSAAVLATALDVATDRSLAVAGGAAATVQLLYVASGHLWGVAALFFGLWLIPMGWLVIRSRWLPHALGWLLIVAGACYVLSAFVSYLFLNADLVTQLLTVPSIIGEVWIMAYLVIFGVHRRARVSAPRPEAVRAPEAAR
jgi:hypothetical protein